MPDVLKTVFSTPRMPHAPEPGTGGLAHFMREHDGRPIRYHLRVEPDGSGLLLANASAAVRLSPTGIIIARALLETRDTEQAVAQAVADRFGGVPLERVQQDVATLRAVLDELASPRPGTHPLRNLDDAGATIHRRRLGAPFCADVTVGPDPNAQILKHLWDAGVPQVIFSLLPDASPAALVPLVERAEDLGLIAGVRCSAGTLEHDGLLEALVRVGLDHVDVFFAGEVAHDGLLGAGDHAAARLVLARARELEVYPMAVLPIVARTFDQLDAIADELAALGVPAATVFTLVAPTADDPEALIPDEVRQAAVTIEEIADQHDLAMIWAPPVERDPARDCAQQVTEGPRPASYASIRVLPNGAVLPPDGPATPAGNLLRDRWPDIWSHRAFHRHREAVDDPTRCDSCPGLALCAAGCPARAETWARRSPEDQR